MLRAIAFVILLFAAAPSVKAQSVSWNEPWRMLEIRGTDQDDTINVFTAFNTWVIVLINNQYFPVYRNGSLLRAVDPAFIFIHAFDGSDSVYLSGLSSMGSRFRGTWTWLGDGDYEYYVGSDYDDYCNGGDGYDVMYMGLGDDSAYGGPGNDYIDLGAGVDYVHGGSGYDTAVGENFDDTFISIEDIQRR